MDSCEWLYFSVCCGWLILCMIADKLQVYSYGHNFWYKPAKWPCGQVYFHLESWVIKHWHQMKPKKSSNSTLLFYRWGKRSLEERSDFPQITIPAVPEPEREARAPNSTPVSSANDNSHAYEALEIQIKNHDPGEIFWEMQCFPYELHKEGLR